MPGTPQRLLAAASCAAVVVCGCGATKAREVQVQAPGEPVHYLPGGRATLARGPAPGGTWFSIQAERYRFEGAVYFNLSASDHQREGASGGTNLDPEREGRRPLGWTDAEGCTAQAVRWTIVFGLLSEPRDRAYAYVGRHRYPLHAARIPPRFQAHGDAVYAALPAAPTRIAAYDRAGARVMRQELEGSAGERCQPGTMIMRAVPSKKS
jgi:hypothetical protein